MQPVIKVNDLVQEVHKKTVLDGINLEVFPGEALGIFGNRSTGKTALLHILAGVERFKSGSVEILGHNSRQSDKFKKHLGLLTQQRSLFQELKVAENLDFMATLRGADRAAITPLVERLALTELLPQPVNALAAGDYQRVALACALLNDPDILIADELVKDLDLSSRQLLLQEIKRLLQGGGTFIGGFSNLDDACAMNRVACLAGGRLSWPDLQEARAEWHRQLKQFAGPSGESYA